MKTEDFEGMDQFKRAFNAVYAQRDSYRQFYTTVTEIAQTVASTLAQCGCIGERLPRGYRVSIDEGDRRRLHLQRWDDPYHEGQMRWHNLDTVGEEMIPRPLIRNFYADLQHGWLADLAAMLEANAIENKECETGLKKFRLVLLDDGDL